ncbi:RNA-binding cell elongation regulator Jag/EloR [Anaeroselena agilis]|uniref:RNA-binding protein KhpB n=1 Tax=Anaeroselena agilis TaxID=3063788 RepID=A0ABU3P2S3_9FIRM|nr:RNA-binding cell elongation regulator Jag/EloR [Selenomonadales bacterium 4137-cl]
MTSVEKTGKTVDEAVEAAIAELGVSRDQIEYEVLEEPSKGLFGFLGGKPARVRVNLLAGQSPAAISEPQEKKELVSAAGKATADSVEVAKTFLQSIFTAMKLNVKIEKLTGEEQVTLNLRGEDLGILIGKHGQTLDALQYLTNLAAHRDSDERVRIIIDVEDYRKRREETLVRLAQRLADRAKLRGEKVVLEPMSPHERKIIHTALQTDQRVTTFSEGEEPFRKVVITPKR